MGKVSMLTVIPANLAKQLSSSGSVHEYNAMPQIDRKVLEAVRDFMSRKVGYSELPMACFGLPDKSTKLGSVQDLLTYLPMNNRESVLFQLEMPEDMIVSVSFSVLLETSNCVEGCDEDEAEIFLEDFDDMLHTGMSEHRSEEIIFIPFLDKSRCKFYACVDETFSTNEFNLPGIARMDIRKLTSFM